MLTAKQGIMFWIIFISSGLHFCP